MRLRDLFSNDAAIEPQAEAVVVKGLAVDSRAVKPGDLFFALAGSKTDGSRFIESAIGSGAVAIAGDHPTRDYGVPFVVTPNPRRALALAGARFYPKQPQTIAAVTGTSGKTSVAALTRDHMDYHPDVVHYLAAKLRLFRDLVSTGGAAVISADHDCSQQVIDAAHERKLRIIAVGRNADGVGEGIRLVDAAVDGFAQKLVLEHRGQKYIIKLPLVGEFQIENALVAAGLAIGTASEPDAVFASLEHLEGAKGRLEQVGEHNGAPIFVDYAHKPDALAKALQALRPYAKRKLVVVFGAGGDRDAGKRPLMGAIATEFADSVIVTDDNPRSENPDAIRAAILSAAKGAKDIGDRAEAIRTAIAGLQPGDALLIAGKGHETGQIIGDRTLPFSDHDAVT